MADSVEPLATDLEDINMAIPFTPPQEIINEYFNRKRPEEIAAETVQQIPQTLLAYQTLQQQQNIANAKQALLNQEAARKGREQFYNYGDVASLPKADQYAIANPTQGPVTEQGVGPQKSPIVQNFESFLQQNPQGLKGREMTADVLYTQDEEGNLIPQGSVERPIKGKTIITKPKTVTDQKRTFQLKGFLETPEGKVPISYDTRTGQMVQGEVQETPLLPIVAPSVPGAEVAKIGDLLNLKEKLKTIDKNYDPQFVGMIESRVQNIKQMTGVGASEKAAYFRQVTQDIKDSLLRARSGAQINEQEYRRLLPLVPNEGMSEVDFLAKRKRFEEVLDEMIQSKQKAFGAAGYRATNIQPTPQEGLDPARKARLEALRAKRDAGTLR